MRLSRELSERILTIASSAEILAWLGDVDKQVGGLKWTPLGGRLNNIHSVEVASDSASGAVERVINSIDALLDLRALEKGETAATPHEAAHRWFDVPKNGISGLSTQDRQRLANQIRVTNIESGIPERPTITFQDMGTGQHPLDFPMTLLSIGEANKKSKTHQIGVYNAGGASTYLFCPYTIIVSRRAPQLLDSRTDDIGVSVVRYNELDPNKNKTGTYEYCISAKDGATMTLDLEGGEIPGMPFGTYIKHIEYELTSYSRAAHEPKRSLHHLFHAALPNPPLPFWIEETRTARFPGMKGKGERRVVSGLVARLKNKGVADYGDEREIKLGADVGSVTLRYFLLNEDQEADAFVTPSQGMALVLHGQRHGTNDRYWVKRMTNFNYIWSRLIILVECDKLQSLSKRQVFASTRETSRTGPLPDRIKKRVIEELKDDDELAARDEEARNRMLSDATKSASDKVKKQLADKIAAFIKGPGLGKQGGGTAGVKPPVRPDTPPKPPVPHKPRNIDDAGMLDIPDTLTIVNGPVEVTAGRTASFRIYLNAKNDFLPQYSKNLSVVVGKGLQTKVRAVSSGRLLGGQARISVTADADAKVDARDMITVTLVVPELSVALMAQAQIVIKAPRRMEDGPGQGGDANVNITWIGRDKWDKQIPQWDEATVGVCNIGRQDAKHPQEITSVDFLLNAAFKPYESVLKAKKLAEGAFTRFQDGYQIPVCWGLFHQQLAEEQSERNDKPNNADPDDDETKYLLPSSYTKAERARMAQAILLAMDPELDTVIFEEGAA